MKTLCNYKQLKPCNRLGFYTKTNVVVNLIERKSAVIHRKFSVLIYFKATSPLKHQSFCSSNPSRQ